MLRGLLRRVVVVLIIPITLCQVPIICPFYNPSGQTGKARSYNWSLRSFTPSLLFNPLYRQKRGAAWKKRRLWCGKLSIFPCSSCLHPSYCQSDLNVDISCTVFGVLTEFESGHIKVSSPWNQEIYKHSCKQTTCCRVRPSIFFFFGEK